jgi:arylsulfatase A-like enzyme
VTTDHGELQGDFGLLFKGPYHVDALMRIPLIWRPSPITQSGGTDTAIDVTDPVGLVDLAPTMCSIAGLAPPSWMEGTPLPRADDGTHERVITEWDSVLFGVEMHLKSICRNGFLATTYDRGTVHDGTEGELYVLDDDPLQHENRWRDPSLASVKADLIDDLRSRSSIWNRDAREIEAPV